MKKHLSKLTIGVLGVCIGFALCYFLASSPGPLKIGNNAAGVKIARDGSLYLSGTQVDLSQLSASLKQQAAYKCMIDFSPDDGYPANKRLGEVLEACNVAGVSRVAVRTPWRPFR